MPRSPSSSTNTCGASTTSPRTSHAAATSRAIDAPSLCPTSTGRSSPSAAHSAGTTSAASSCMNRGVRFPVGRSEKPWPSAGVGHRAATGGRGDPAVDASPEADRAESLVQEQQRRECGVAGDVVVLDAPTGDVEERQVGHARP